jgi:hypothetical protein
MVTHYQFYSSVVNDHAVYLSAHVREGTPSMHYGDTVFIDREMQIPLSSFGHPTQIDWGFYICYDRNTGAYKHLGVIPDEQASSFGGTPVLINNHILSMGAVTGHPLFIVSFRDDGVMMERLDTIIYHNVTVGLRMSGHESGHLFFHVSGKGDATFGNLTVHGCEVGQAYLDAAFFAMYYNASLLTPYEYDNITEQPPLSSLSLYPNPATTDIYIRFEESGFEKAELYSLQGQKLGEYTSLHIPVSNLVSGMYILKVYTSKQVMTAKFLKTD